MNTINILIVDDHPLTCQGYGIILQNATAEGKLPKIIIDVAYNAADAYDKLKDVDTNSSKYDLILLDILIPVSAENKIFSGEDLGVLIRKLNPQIKIIVQTGLLDNYRLHSIFKNLNPEGIIIKSDLDDIIFIQSISDVLSNVPFYSQTFTKLLRNQFSKGYILDADDREMLFLFSVGVASKDIPNHLPWSLSKLDKRKRLLREKLRVEDKSVFALVSKAKEAGFL